MPLLLHPWPQLRGLSGANWVVALDLKGFGDSDKPYLTRQYREQVIVDELKQFVDVLQVRRGGEL